MARITSIRLPEKTLKQIGRLASETDEFAGDILKAGAAVVLPIMRANLQASIGRGEDTSRSTGQLVAALGISPLGVTRGGDYNVSVGFAENRDDGVVNALLANLLEYGSTTRAAHPFMNKTRNASKAGALQAMTQVIEKRVKGR